LVRRDGRSVQSQTHDLSNGAAAGFAAEGFGRDERGKSLVSSFAAAADANGGATADRHAVAGAQVLLRFASPELRESLAPAFAHLACPGAPAGGPYSLTVNLWDSATTGAPPPARPPVPVDVAPGALFHFQEASIRGAYQPGLETLSVFDAGSGVAWHWVADAAAQPYWDKACPIRQILSWWLALRGSIQLHGAAVGTGSVGVLLVGKGGSGKSTTALSTLGSDLRYAGDDYVAASVDPDPWVHSLYNSGKLEPDHLHGLLPHLVPLVANLDERADEKAVIYVQQHFPEQTTEGFALGSILVPTIQPAQRESRIISTSRAAAFAALAPSTMLQLHTADSRAWQAMSRLVARVPCFGLELGSDVAAIPGLIGEFIAGLSSA
jgi:hypothetical protein